MKSNKQEINVRGCLSRTDKKENLRVPSKRVAIVSKNVFWGARSPLRVGIGWMYRNRGFDLLTASTKRQISKKGKIEFFC